MLKVKGKLIQIANIISVLFLLEIKERNIGGGAGDTRRVTTVMYVFFTIALTPRIPDL